MTLPTDWPVPVIDAFALLEPGAASVDVTMPLELLRDDESRAAWPSTDIVSYMFGADADRERRKQIARDVPSFLEHLDRWSVSKVQVPVLASAPDSTFDQLAAHADRIFLSVRVNPHDGTRGLRRLDELARRYPSVRSVSLSPHMISPLVPPNSKEYYPVYAKCVELDIAVYINVGFPGPRVPAAVQDPIHLDEVCWFFPDLRVVMRHGGEPWVDTCVKMLLRWPNLYFATTGFAPRYYPKAIIDFANTRGAKKIIFAGYFPTLSHERVFSELRDLPLRPEVWPRFLSANAVEAFRLAA